MKEVKEELLQLIDEIGKHFETFPWDSANAYKEWMAQTYFFVRHTPIFLGLTASRWGVKNPEQQNKALAHLREEMGHDLLLINDLKVMGESINNFSEWPETQAFYQTQYYWIEHETPAAHLGYAYLLEGMASQKCLQAHKKVVAAHGKQAATFLKVHAEEDSGHFEQGLKNLENLNTFELRCFIECARQAAVIYTQILTKAKSKA